MAKITVKEHEKTPVDLPPVDDKDKKPPRRKLHIVKPKSPAQKVWLIVVNVFFTLALVGLIFAVFIGVRARQSGEPAKVGGFSPYFIATASMEPTFAVDGFVLVKDDGFTEVEVGDVVAFRAAALRDKVAMHRIIAIAGEGDDRKLFVKGDNNPQPDGAPVTLGNFAGRVVFHTNLTASWLNILHGRFGLFFAVIMPLAVMILLYMALRWLIGGATTPLGKALGLSVFIFLLSASLFLSLLFSAIRSVGSMNRDLATIAGQFAGSTATTEWRVAGKTVIGVIELPRLGLSYPIIEYENQLSLDRTIAHFGGVALNDDGNSVLLGARYAGDALPFNIFFTRLSDLSTGDTILITNIDREKVKYVVKEFETVPANDDGVLNARTELDTRELTLIAATNDMTQWFVVVATESE